MQKELYNTNNDRRFNENDGLDKRIMIDIDGVLNYYPDCWVEYVNEKTEVYPR